MRVLITLVLTAVAAVSGMMPLSGYEYHVACSIVMGEAGGETERGMLLVAQTLRDGCEQEGVMPSELKSLYRYEGWNEDYTEAVEQAVRDVFFLGKRVTEERTLYFYNPQLCSSSWHEAQAYVTTEGSVRFFQ